MPSLRDGVTLWTVRPKGVSWQDKSTTHSDATGKSNDGQRAETVCRDIYRPWGDLITIQGRGRGAEQGTITEPQEHTQDTGSPRKVRPLGHGRTGTWVAHDDTSRSQVPRRLKPQAPVGPAILHCSGINAGTTISFFFNGFHVLLSMLCTVNPILGYNHQTKATDRMCEVLLSHLNGLGHDKLRSASFPNMCSAIADLLNLLGFEA